MKRGCATSGATEARRSAQNTHDIERVTKKVGVHKLFQCALIGFLTLHPLLILEPRARLSGFGFFDNFLRTFRNTSFVDGLQPRKTSGILPARTAVNVQVRRSVKPSQSIRREIGAGAAIIQLHCEEPVCDTFLGLYLTVGQMGFVIEGRFLLPE